MNEVAIPNHLELMETARKSYDKLRDLFNRVESMSDEKYLMKIDAAIGSGAAMQSALAPFLVPAQAADVERGLLKIMAARPRATKSVAQGSAEEMMQAIWGRMFSEEILILNPPAAAVEMGCREIYLDADKWGADKLPNIAEVVAAVKSAQHSLSYVETRLSHLPELRGQIHDQIERRAVLAQRNADRAARAQG